MKEHDIKVWPPYYAAIEADEKLFEVRKNDRDYQVGDVLRMREYAPGPDEYTGKQMRRKILYMISGDEPLGFAFGLRPGFVCMSIEPGASR